MNNVNNLEGTTKTTIIMPVTNYSYQFITHKYFMQKISDTILYRLLEQGRALEGRSHF